MKGSQRSNRPYVRTSRPLASRRGGGAGQLAASAGSARPSLEPLEARQLLFSLTITPDSGGTAQAFFGYTIPYLVFPDDIDEAEPQDPVVEGFNDEGGDMGVPIDIVPSGTVFTGSNIRVDHTIANPAFFRLRDNQPDEDGEPTMGEIALEARPNAGSVVRWRFQAGEDSDVFVGVSNFAFDAYAGQSSPTGLPIFDDEGNAAMTIDLLFQGEVVASFSGQEIVDQKTTFELQPGVGTFSFAPPFGADSPVFDEVRMSFDISADRYFMDNLSYTPLQGRYTGLLSGRVFGAEVKFSGPVGASVEFRDLYGRPMAQTIALGQPQGLGNLTLVDLNDDGIPEFNDGIGQIIFSNTDENTTFSLVGGTIEPGDPDPDAAFFENGFNFQHMTTLTGFFSEFEAIGFGYIGVTDGDDVEVVGLPAGPGSVIVGAPWQRDNSSEQAYAPGGFATANPVLDPAAFNRPDQGVKVLDGAPIGTVNIHGVLHGSSDFTGYVNNFWVGYLVGSVSVAGDIGSLVVGSDAGLWAVDPGIDVLDLLDEDTIVTGSELLVGRTIGEISIAGRSTLNTTVGGDLNDVTNKPPRDVLRYDERELTLGISFDADTEIVISEYSGGVAGSLFPTYGQFTPVYGNGTYRNDTILSAEFVSNASTAAEIQGILGFGDPINSFEDRTDVYAFAADGTQPIVIENQAGGTMLMRVVDQDGRTVAATRTVDQELTDLSDFVRLEFTPDMPGVYYLVLTANDAVVGGDEDVGTGFGYVASLTGMAPVSLGSYRTGGSSGATSDPDDANTVNVLSGSVGMIRVGTAWAGSAGGEVDPRTTFNTDEEELDNAMDFRGGTFSVSSGNLYNITTGSDFGEADFFNPINFFIGGDLGTIVTGISSLVGQSPFEGDLGVVNILVDGSIGMLDIRGGIGISQDVDDPQTEVTLLELDSVNISVGENPDGPVEIGMIRAGSRLYGPAFNLNTAPGTVIGAFLIDQDTGLDPTAFDDTGIISEAPNILTGSDSDVRFAHFNQIDGVDADEVTEFSLGTPVQFTDDGGGQVQISISGGDGNPNSFVRALPIDDSEGVAIAEILVDLSGGGTLNITSQGSPSNTDVISIGKILVVGASGAASIVIDGPSEVDVWMIEQQGGAALTSIANRTQNGDIVAIDVVGLSTLEIDEGNLGRTQVPTWGPRTIGPFLGVSQGTNATVGGAIGIGGFVNPNWNGQTYRPLDDSTASVYLDDMGSPVDPYLNGLIVRSGDLASVLVSDQVGDVIVASGNLLQVTADFDESSPVGEFHGIVGSIYADTVLNVDIGDGLAASAPAPLATTGIFANLDVGAVSNPGNPGAVIASAIVAGVGGTDGDPVGTDILPDVVGLGDITLTDGDFVGAFVGTTSLDDFWLSGFIPGSDLKFFTGFIRELSTNGGDFIRSAAVTIDLPLFRLDDGFFDASTIEVSRNADLIRATGYRNSTLEGGDLEFRLNQIEVGEDLDVLETSTQFGGDPLEDDPVGIGDIIDLRVDVLGSITGRIAANNFTRVDLDVDGTIQLLEAEKNIRGSSITAGRLEMGQVAENIRTSTFNVSGPIIDLTADQNITNTRIRVTGPDGRIELIETAGLLSGQISASGPITTIRSTGGDIVARITTTTGEGDVMMLEAARDLDIVTDISGTLDMLTAGRHIGNIGGPDVILVRDDVATVEAGGQLYSDIRIGGSLTGSVTLGPVAARPSNDLVGGGSIIAFERIELVEVTGDFGGSVISYTDGIGTVRVVDGSFRQGGIVAAYDGSLGLLEVVRGHLLGDVHADVDINTIRVVGSDDGVFGDIGINPALSTGVAADALRNQLPPGAVPTPAIQGPTITSGEQIRNIITTNGSVFEATILAGTFFANMDVNGGIANDTQTAGRGTVIAAGNKLNDVTITGDVSNALFIAGVSDFGVDGRPGGVGVDADTVKRGFIRKISIGGDATNVDFSAGIKAGSDGVYNTADDTVEFGKSRINTIQVAGTATNASAFGDAFVNAGNNVSNGIARSGISRPVDDPQIAPGIPQGDALIPMDGSSFAFSYAGGSGTITFTDSGAAPLTGAYWDAGSGTITLVKTSKNAQLIVNSDSGPLANLNIITNDDASVGLIRVNADLTGDSDIIIDNKLRNLEIQGFDGTGTIRAGGDILNFTAANLRGGNVAAHYVRNLTIAGDFGRLPAGAQQARIDLFSVENVSVGGGFHGTLNVSRYLGLFQEGSFTVEGLMRRGVLRVGESAGPIQVGQMEQSRVVVNDEIDSVDIDGDMIDAAIIAGGDLGEDAAFGGIGSSADRTTSGNIGPVDIGGDFVQSDIVAGMLRGPDGYFGTGDDSLADGRSDIGMVTIGGTVAGSNLNSESFRISTTGVLAGVQASGDDFFGIGNVDVDPLDTQPLPIQVTELRVTQESFSYYAEIAFNQNMNESTLGAALSVSEVRGGGQVTITLDNGADYQIEYDDVNFIARVFFSEQITERDLPQVGDEPGPGVYRFELDEEALRAQLVNARLDGDGDGFAEPDDRFSEDDIVGDAGDKIDAQTVTVGDPGGNQFPIDFYAATDLDNVMDSNFTFDGLPDANDAFTLRGFLGDHPDNNLDVFSFASDVDLYKITLQAGQILRLGQMNGGAAFAARAVLDSDGNGLMATTRSEFDLFDFFDFFDDGDAVPFADIPEVAEAGDNLVQRGGITPELTRLPNNPLVDADLTTEDVFLVTETGTYYLAVTNTDQFQAGIVPDIPAVPGGTGAYSFTVEVFDDGDSGFAATTDAGNGTRVVNAPSVSSFAGPDGVFGTGDDADTISLGDFSFTLDPGADGLLGTSDDVVSGDNGKGISSTLSGQTLTSTIRSAIGTPLSAGVPSDVQADVDIYHLNNKGLIDPGTRMRITVELTELGADLGSRTQDALLDFSGNAQFALFDTTGASGVSDASLVFSPSDFSATGQTPRVIADDGQTSYGYDDNGDFFVEFVTPGRNGPDGPLPATYAVYLQGAFNADYQISVETEGSGQYVPSTQNVFLELNGGTIDWLEAGGLETELAPFTTSVVGFSGKIDFVSVDDLVVTKLIDNLEAAFAAAGVNVNFSTNPADFEFQDFSTVFLTRTIDPINFFSDQFYGASEHTDVLNADRNDEAAVFVPTLSALGIAPGEAGVDRLANSLTAAVGRRVGELLGLRAEASLGFAQQTVNMMAANSPEVIGTDLSYRFSTTSQRLSTGYDSLTETIFYLGQQDADSLLDRILAE